MNNLDENNNLLHKIKKSTNSFLDYIGLFRGQKKFKGMKTGKKLVTKEQQPEDYSRKAEGGSQDIASVKIEAKKSSETKKESNDSNTPNFITVSPFMGKVISIAFVLIFLLVVLFLLSWKFKSEQLK